MELKFFSIDEVKEFVKQLKGARGGKGGDADDGPQTGTTAPAPLAPPQGGTAPGPFNPGAFAAPAAGAGQAGGAFPAAGVTGPAPEVLALVQRISAKIDGAVAGGQPADTVLAWFRGQCGPEAAQASMDQIKSTVMPRMPQPMLEQIAKLMNA